MAINTCKSVSSEGLNCQLERNHPGPHLSYNQPTSNRDLPDIHYWMSIPTLAWTEQNYEEVEDLLCRHVASGSRDVIQIDAVLLLKMFAELRRLMKVKVK